MSPRLPLEIQQYIVSMTAENYNLPPNEAPFYSQDPYWGSSRSYWSSPCMSMPLLCRNLRKTGEAALYATVRIQGSNIWQILGTLGRRSELGQLVKCINIGKNQETGTKLDGITIASLRSLLHFCSDLKGLVTFELPSLVSRGLHGMIEAANLQSSLTYLALSDHEIDELPSNFRPSTRFRNLRRLWVGDVVLLPGNLESYIGSNLRRLELTHIRALIESPLPTPEQLRILFSSAPALCELVLVQFEKGNPSRTPITDFYLSVITALEQQLELLVIDGAVEPKIPWKNYPPLTLAWEQAICKCPKLDSLYLRRIKLRDTKYLPTLQVNFVAVVQCFVDEKQVWKRYPWPKKWARKGPPPRPDGGAWKGDRHSATAIEHPAGAKEAYCEWIVYANSTKAQRDAHEKEIFIRSWPSEISPWYTSIEHYCTCDWRTWQPCECTATVAEDGEYKRITAPKRALKPNPSDSWQPRYDSCRRKRHDY